MARVCNPCLCPVDNRFDQESRDSLEARKARAPAEAGARALSYQPPEIFIGRSDGALRPDISFVFVLSGASAYATLAMLSDAQGRGAPPLSGSARALLQGMSPRGPGRATVGRRQIDNDERSQHRRVTTFTSIGVVVASCPIARPRDTRAFRALDTPDVASNPCCCPRRRSPR